MVQKHGLNATSLQALPAGAPKVGRSGLEFGFARARSAHLLAYLYVRLPSFSFSAASVTYASLCSIQSQNHTESKNVRGWKGPLSCTLTLFSAGPGRKRAHLLSHFFANNFLTFEVSFHAKHFIKQRGSLRPFVMHFFKTERESVFLNWEYFRDF